MRGAVKSRFDADGHSFFATAVYRWFVQDRGQIRKGDDMKTCKTMIVLGVFFFCTAAKAAGIMEISVKLAVPDSAWTLSIDEIHTVKEELWVVSSVSRDPDLMGAQVISMTQDTVKISAPVLPVKYFVIGKTWNWENEEPYTFITDLKPIEQDLQSTTLLYKKEVPKQK